MRDNETGLLAERVVLYSRQHNTKASKKDADLLRERAGSNILCRRQAHGNLVDQFINVERLGQKINVGINRHKAV